MFEHTQEQLDRAREWVNEHHPNDAEGSALYDQLVDAALDEIIAIDDAADAAERRTMQ